MAWFNVFSEEICSIRWSMLIKNAYGSTTDM